MKKRIVLLAVLLVLCIAGQALLLPSFGTETIGDSLSISMEQKQIGELTDTNGIFSSSNSNPETGSLQGRLIQQLFLMIGLVGLIGVGAWFFCKKIACNWTTGKGRTITVTETVSLGPRKLIHIVRVGSKQYLLGSTPENIRLLAEVTESINENNE